MKLNIFKKILSTKKEQGKPYVVICGTREICMLFSYLAQKYNFQLDGVIVIDQPQLMPEDYSGVPIIDFNKNSIPIKQCLIIFAIPNEYAQMIMNQLRGMGFSVFVPINNHDANEIITFFQHNNYLLDKVKESFQGGGLKHTYILNTSDKSSLINKILSVSEFSLMEF